MLARNRNTGVLTPAGCIGDGGGACAPAVGLIGAQAVAVSPDGKHVYVAASGGHSVAAFARNRKTGALTQLAGSAACFSAAGNNGCTAGVGLESAHSVAISPDGRNVYVGSRFDRVLAVFTRNRRTGALTQRIGTDACVSEDGGACAVGLAVDAWVELAVSPDGKHVYVTSPGSNSVAAFARNRRTSVLTQLAGSAACAAEDGPAGCATATAMEDATGVVVSPDNNNVYAVATSANALAAFARER